MTSQQLIQLVNNFESWKGNTFTLAMLVMQQQKEDDAALVDAVSPDASALIRES